MGVQQMFGIQFFTGWELIKILANMFNFSCSFAQVSAKGSSEFRQLIKDLQFCIKNLNKFLAFYHSWAPSNPIIASLTCFCFSSYCPGKNKMFTKSGFFSYMYVRNNFSYFYILAAYCWKLLEIIWFCQNVKSCSYPGKSDHKFWWTTLKPKIRQKLLKCKSLLTNF